MAKENSFRISFYLNLIHQKAYRIHFLFLNSISNPNSLSKGKKLHGHNSITQNLSITKKKKKKKHIQETVPVNPHPFHERTDILYQFFSFSMSRGYTV